MFTIKKVDNNTHRTLNSCTWLDNFQRTQQLSEGPWLKLKIPCIQHDNLDATLQIKIVMKLWIHTEKIDTFVLQIYMYKLIRYNLYLQQQRNVMFVQCMLSFPYENNEFKKFKFFFFQCCSYKRLLVCLSVRVKHGRDYHSMYVSRLHVQFPFRTNCATVIF